MWGALKSDFTEFVSTVTTDAAETLTAIDVQLDVGDMKRRAERMDSMRMTDPDSRLVVDESDSDSEPSPPPSMEEMRDFLHGCEALFLEVLPDPEETTTAAADSPDDGDDAPPALVTLDLNEKTEDIANLLKIHASLETTFSTLTDQVEYKDFWKRYYWRLDPSRLRDTYEYYYEMEQQQQQQVAAANATAASGSNAALASVTSFLGGAVKRMIDDEGNEAVDGDQHQPQPQPQPQQEGQFFNTAQQTSVSAMNFFKNAGVGRPPFVLNTAVSEDDEDDEEDEDEEEFGWDDDEDEDEDDDEDADDNEEGGEDKDEDEGDDNEGQIEFKDAEKEQLQEELAQAMIERDMLHKTVKMQTDELKKLKEGVASKDESQQVQALKMQVFEKDSELAALRARLEEEDDEAAANKVGDTTTATTPPTASSVELKSLQSEVANRDVEIQQLKQGLQASVDRSRTLEEQLETEASDTHHQLNDALQASKSQQSALEQASAQNTELETGLEAMKTAMANLEGDYDMLQQEQARAQKTPGTEMKAQLAVAQKDLVKAHSQVDALSFQSESLNETLQQHLFRISQLEDDLSSTQTVLQQKEEDLANKVASWHDTQSELEQTKAELEKAVTVTVTLAATTKAAQPSSPGSNSTGVQVPSSPVAGAPESPDPKPPVLDAIPVDLPVAAADDGNDDNGDEENDDGSDWGDW